MNPQTQRLNGWIFDAYPEPGGMRVWIITPEGRSLNILDPWWPRFYIGNRFKSAAALLKAKRFPIEAAEREKTEVFSGKPLRVLEVRVPPERYFPLAKEFQDRGFSLFDADVHLVQAFHYDRGHFPLARCEFSIEDGRLRAWTLHDSPWDADYALPPLRYLHLALTGSESAGRIDPNHALRGSLALTWEDRTHVLEGSPGDQLESLANCLKDWDPDVITSEWGDSLVLPRLAQWSEKCGIALPFSRAADKGMAGRGDRSFFTYGRTVYQSGVKYLFGRWHLDIENSFFIRESGFEGLYEMARIAQIPVQRASRCTIGTSLSSMQMAEAWRRGILIPMDKQQMEDFRPATELVIADKGGLVYEPEIGWHENVAEYDFVSMYPTLMARHNISPETVNCPCCRPSTRATAPGPGPLLGMPPKGRREVEPGSLPVGLHNVVPEIGHYLCRKRRGIVPNVLEPILEKRAEYKRRAKAGGENAGVYKRRATAFKWVLVCCFGYLGFKNSRFGKIESHECVTAWGREILLRAKEAAEGRGLHVLHANVDAIYVQCLPDTDYEALRRHIESVTGCPVGLEGVYKWLRFCPSRMDAQSGVPNKYFGAFRHGELKIRGIALRRRDTPPLLKRMQEEMLARLNREEGLAGCERARADLLAIVADYRERIESGQVSAQDLAITFHLSKDPSEYVHDTLSSIAARKLQASGVSLHAGETVRYVICSAKDRVKDWRAMPLALLEVLDYDIGKYVELLERAAGEICELETSDARRAKEGARRLAMV